MVRFRIPERVEAQLLEELITASFDPRYGERWSPEQVLSAFTIPGTRAVIASTGPGGGQPVGFALTRQVLDEAELLLIAIVPAARGQGLGGRLLDHVIAGCEAAGARNMYLEVRDGNSAALALYKSRGFEVVGRRSGYYRSDNGQLLDALTMHLALSS